MKEKIKNLTPHRVVVRKSDGTEVFFEPSGKVVRAKTTQEKIGEIDGIEIFKEVLGNIEGIEKSDLDGVDAVIVSRIVAEKFKRENPNIRVFIPNTGKAIRDANGRIIAVEGFVEVD